MASALEVAGIAPGRRTVLRVATTIPQQAAVWASRSPYLLYLGGRGAGKTHAGAIWALTRPAGQHGLIAAPTHRNLLAGALSSMLSIAYGAGLVRQHNKQEGWIRLIDEKVIYLRSLDRPELVRGINASWLWGDELGILQERTAWDILIACIRGPGFRQRMVTTTPPLTGKNHWLYETFVEKAVPGVHEVIKIRTAENTYLPAEFEGELRREFAEAYAARELDAEWVDVGAVNVYDVSKILYQPTPPEGLTRHARGWDTAATAGAGDYTAGVLMSLGADGKVYVRDVVRGQWAPAERDRMLRSAAESDGVGVTVALAKARGDSGVSQMATWAKLLAGFRFIGELESGEKAVRAGPLAALMGAGLVVVTAEPGRWENYWHDGKRLSAEQARRKFAHNLGLFPIGRTKDESDAAYQALQSITKRHSQISVGSYDGGA